MRVPLRSRPRVPGAAAGRRGGPRSYGRGVTRSRVVLPRGRKVSNSGRGASQCPPAEPRPALWHPLPFLSPAVASPSQGSPPPRVPFQKSLLPSLHRSPRINTLGASPTGCSGASGRPGVGGRGTSVPKRLRGARSWARGVARGQWPARVPSATGGIISAAYTPSRANSAGPQPTPRGLPPPRPRPSLQRGRGPGGGRSRRNMLEAGGRTPGRC